MRLPEGGDMKQVEILQLIRTRLERRGNGKTTPLRILEQYWDMEGNLVFEIDPEEERLRSEKLK